MFGLLHDLIITTAYAQTLGPQCNGIFSNGGFNDPGGGFTCLTEYIRFRTLFTISLVASICLIMIIINGFRWMLGPAVPGGSTDSAKKGISAALMGLALSLLAYVILATIISSVTN